MTMHAAGVVCTWIFKIVALSALVRGCCALQKDDLADGILMLSVVLIILVSISAHRICVAIEELKKLIERSETGSPRSD